jgi:O-methyltransferase
MSRLDSIARQALSSVHTLQASFDIARAALMHSIPGEFVECGVFAGAQAAAMALAIMDPIHYWSEHREQGLGLDRRVHLFDSFQGIPLAGPEDVEFLAAGHKAGLSTCSRAQVVSNMQEWGVDPDLLVYHDGWFQDTVPNAEISQIAVLRLDGDLYESTKVCMQHFYHKVSPGGWVIVDDYHLSGCRKAVEEFVNPGPIYFLK